MPFLSVRLIGLEPTRLATPDPKSDVSTNFTTGAYYFTIIRKQRGPRSPKDISVHDRFNLRHLLFRRRG